MLALAAWAMSPGVARGQQSGPRFVRFLQLSCARCGSSYIDEMIGSHPCVHSVGEKLPYMQPMTNLQRLGASASREDWVRAQNDIFAVVEAQVEARLAAYPEWCPFVLVGGKLPYERFGSAAIRHFHEVVRVLGPEGNYDTYAPARLLFNLRNNSLDRVVAHLAPKLFGSKHACSKGDTLKQCIGNTSATVDVNNLVQLMVKNEVNLRNLGDEIVTMATRFKTPLLSIRYEDVLRDPVAMFADFILPFLGLDPGYALGLSSLHAKRTGNLMHADLIRNFEDLSRAVRLAGLGDALVDEATRNARPAVALINAPPPPLAHAETA